MEGWYNPASVNDMYEKKQVQSGETQGINLDKAFCGHSKPEQTRSNLEGRGLEELLGRSPHRHKASLRCIILEEKMPLKGNI